MIDAIEFLLDGESWTRDRNGLLDQLIEQLLLTFTALGLALLVGLPIALWLGHIGRGGLLAINISNIGRAVPTFALLAVLVRLEWPGNDVFGPYGRAGLATLLALLFFALPPIITQAYVGVREVDAGVREAATGMGMSGWQLFRRVELPLAMPLLISGVRLALVQVWATATIASLVGGPGLGNVLQLGFANLDRRSEGIGAAILVAAIALVLELLAALVQRAVDPVPRTARAADRDQMSMLPPTVSTADSPVG